jgi:hypothetical protein
MGSLSAMAGAICREYRSVLESVSTGCDYSWSEILDACDVVVSYGRKKSRLSYERYLLDKCILDSSELVKSLCKLVVGLSVATFCGAFKQFSVELRKLSVSDIQEKFAVHSAEKLSAAVEVVEPSYEVGCKLRAYGCYSGHSLGSWIIPCDQVRSILTSLRGDGRWVAVDIKRGSSSHPALELTE